MVELQARGLDFWTGGGVTRRRSVGNSWDLLGRTEGRIEKGIMRTRNG